MDINYSYLLLEFVITVIIYLFLPFVIFFKNKNKYDITKRKKIILLNSIILSILFVIYKTINNYENAAISFAPALFYYYINKWIWCKSKKEQTENNKIMEESNANNKNNMKENNLKTIFIFITILVLIVSVTISLTIEIKEKSEKEKLQLKFENETTNEDKRQFNLSECITRAKNARSNLWNANCTKESDGSCTIKNNDGTIDWIEKRYQQDLNNCYQLYGK